ncbi:MAG: S-layer homology domain-containing protein, partial [Clostridia bacterium]|nr:S-layer homology domain-containing protein [Clostridia bacterium]
TIAPTTVPTATPVAIPVATKKPYISSGGSPTLSTSKTTPKPTVAPTTVPTSEPSTTTVPKETPDVSGENNVPQLNKTEHYAYIVGYPEGDVRPERHITREEVATVFFRLLTDASRTEYWMQTNGFDDVADDRWSNNAISTMTNANVIAGYEDNTFRPWVAITRAEFAAMAARFDSGEYNGENKFSDIDGHWAAEEINRAAERGWISGYEDGTFRPNQYITRAEAMTLINKMLERIVTPEGIHKDAIFWPDNLPEMWYYTAVEEATNSHDYEKNEDGIETWTKINPPRNWEKLERAWSKADSAGHEDSVMYGE